MEIWDTILNAVLAMSALEVIAVSFGIASVVYSKKENILVYPTGIISTLIYVYLCFGFKLYADMGINLFYFGMSIYGWIMWNSKIEDTKLQITSNTLKENLFTVGFTFVIWVILYFILSKFTNSDVPYIDSFTTAVCFVGMWLMAWKKLENWTMWIIADLVSIPLYWYKGLYLTSVQFMFFTVLAVLGYIEWKKKLTV